MFMVSVLVTMKTLMPIMTFMSLHIRSCQKQKFLPLPQLQKFQFIAHQSLNPR